MPPSIHYLSHVGLCGYGVAGRRLALALAGQGVDLTWSPIVFDPAAPLCRDDQPCEPALAPYRRPAGRHAPGRPDMGQPDVVVVHGVPELIPALEHLRPPGGALLCHTVWEHAQLQPHWPALLNRCDGVIVPTAWNAAAFVAAGVTVPIGIVPHTVADDGLDDGWLGPDGLDLGDRFVVHSIASWTDRKQPLRTVEAFAAAFGPNDDAVLVLRTDREIEPTAPAPPGPPHRRRLTSWAAAPIIHQHHPTAPIHLVHDSLSHAQVAALHQRSDCWLSLPHAEGWDLGAFDAAVAGTPVVTTAWGGPLAWLDPASPLLVPGVEVANPHVPGTTWVDPDLDAAVAALRAVAAGRQGRSVEPGGPVEPAAVAAAARAGELRHAYGAATVAGTFLDVLEAMGT